MSQALSKRIPVVGECYQESGRRWIVTDNTAGVISLNPANPKRDESERRLYPSELYRHYKRVR